MLKIFSRKSDLPKVSAELATIPVPDIKEYLVREYERSRGLEDRIKELNIKLDNAYVFKIKHDAALITLEEYSKRISRQEETILKQAEEVRRAKEEVLRMNDELNSYRIRMNDAALTKEEIIDEIITDTKAVIIEDLNNHKGNLSKVLACSIVKNAQPYWKGENNNE